MKNEFKVGDIITGISRGNYNITNSDATMIVTKIEKDDNLISVRILKHKKYPFEKNNNYYALDPDRFKLVTPRKITDWRKEFNGG